MVLEVAQAAELARGGHILQRSQLVLLDQLKQAQLVVIVEHGRTERTRRVELTRFCGLFALMLALGGQLAARSLAGLDAIGRLHLLIHLARDRVGLGLRVRLDAQANLVFLFALLLQTLRLGRVLGRALLLGSLHALLVLQQNLLGRLDMARREALCQLRRHRRRLVRPRSRHNVHHVRVLVELGLERHGRDHLPAAAARGELGGQGTHELDRAGRAAAAAGIPRRGLHAVQGAPAEWRRRSLRGLRRVLRWAYLIRLHATAAHLLGARALAGEALGLLLQLCIPERVRRLLLAVRGLIDVIEVALAPLSHFLGTLVFARRVLLALRVEARLLLGCLGIALVGLLHDLLDRLARARRQLVVQWRVGRRARVLRGCRAGAEHGPGQVDDRLAVRPRGVRLVAEAPLRVADAHLALTHELGPLLVALEPLGLLLQFGGAKSFSSGLLALGLLADGRDGGVVLRSHLLLV